MSLHPDRVAAIRFATGIAMLIPTRLKNGWNGSYLECMFCDGKWRYALEPDHADGCAWVEARSYLSD